MFDRLRKYGEAAIFDFSFYEIDGVDLRVDAVHVSGDTTIMKNEGTPANTTNGFVDEGDTYSITLTATEMECARGVIKLVDQTATKVWLDITIEFETYGHASAQHETFPSDLVSISGDETAANNLELQYDATGLTGDTFPATQQQVGNLSTSAGGLGRLISSFVKDGAESETNTYEATQEGDGTLHIVEDDGGNTGFYYQALVGGNGVASSFKWSGYIQSNGDSVLVKYWDWASSTYKTIKTLIGSNGTTLFDEVFEVPTGATGIGANAGIVRLRFESTTSTAIATDSLICVFSVVAESVGYADGAIWINTNGSNTNTEPYVDGVADNPVSTWAALLTLSTALGINRFRIINGSTITLSANSDQFTLIGEAWTLILNGQSIEGASFHGATMITGIGLATVTQPVFKDCDFGAVTIPPSKMIDCGFGKNSGTFTGGSAGEYFMRNGSSLVPGSGSPSLVFTGLGFPTGINCRGWKGGSNYTLDSDCTLSHEVLVGGGQTFTTGGANVELRGIFRSATFTLSGAGLVQIIGVTGIVTLSGTATTVVNIFGVASSLADTSVNTTVSDETVNTTDIDSILTDTDELQTNQGNWLTATGFSTHSAADVWTSATRTLSSFGTLVSDIATAVWGAGTRTLTSFGTLIADIWANVARTITGTVTTDIASRDASKADVSSLATEATLIARTLIAANYFDPANDQVSLNRILDTLITETNSGDIAKSFSFFYNVSPTTTKTVNDVGVAGVGLTAQQVWEYVTRTLTSGSAPSVVQIRTEMDDNSTKLIDIVADTNELQSDDIPGRLTTIDGNIAAIPTVMRGTDNAALASVATEARLAELDAANMPADIDAIPTTPMRGTDNANTVIPDVAGTAATLHGVTDGKIDAVQIDVTESLDYLAGTWTIVNNQLIHYEKDGTELHRFNLTKAGVPDSDSPDARTRV